MSISLTVSEEIPFEDTFTKFRKIGHIGYIDYMPFLRKMWPAVVIWVPCNMIACHGVAADLWGQVDFRKNA